ncbi:MAG TPA: hypothetical protein VH268_08815 [Solirubrobacterales bacterium]|jgi:hypothetical protein|nr:hypothetical protein [Solirubrobacterales bacterium]
MPGNDQAKPPLGERERSFEAGAEGGYQTDAFSRNDEEGVAADDAGQPDEVEGAEPIVAAGEADGYQTDAFSRGDAEGVPQEALTEPQRKASATPAPASEAIQRKAVDDADSRDARPPMDPREGGVR